MQLSATTTTTTQSLPPRTIEDEYLYLSNDAIMPVNRAVFGPRADNRTYDSVEQAVEAAKRIESRRGSGEGEAIGVLRWSDDDRFRLQQLSLYSGTQVSSYAPDELVGFVLTRDDEDWSLVSGTAQVVAVVDEQESRAADIVA